MINVLCLTPIPKTQADLLSAAGYLLHDHADTALFETAPPNAGTIRAVITRGATGITRTLMDQLPNLSIVCTMAAGFEKVDLEAANERGIVVTHGPGTNATAVADHAIALLFSIARGICYGNSAARRDDWASSRRPRALVNGKRLGIVGLGRIGELIAARMSGLDMRVGYHSRTHKEVPYAFYESIAELAENSDFLVVCIPGGLETAGIVDRKILEALGPTGFLINIARGSIVPTQDLADALTQGLIAGAAIDVYEGEPVLPDALKKITDNLIVTPHMAGAAVESRAAIEALMLENLDLHFAGKPPKTPVPGCRTVRA